MCVVCNPLCGKCRPAQQKLITCSACGCPNIVETEVLGIKPIECVKCHEILDADECAITMRAGLVRNTE